MKIGNGRTKSLKWWQKTLVYEIYPNSFKDSNNDGYGDINGIISKLDYIKSLGVGAIWITPIYDSPMRDNGYDVSDYYSINPRYGTMVDMDNLIKEANDRNIKIIMDLVFNHTSNECSWFKESKTGKNNPKSDWYIWRDPTKDGGPPNNWRSIFGGSAWTYDETRKQYYLHTFADFQPDLNWENEQLRKKLYDVANFWIEKGVGGFRIDAVTYIKKPTDFKCEKIDGIDKLMSIHNEIANTNGILDFLDEFKKEVKEKNKDLFFVGEANGVDISEFKNWVGINKLFDMIFRFDLVNIQFVNGEYWYNTKVFTIKEFKEILSREQNELNENTWGSIFFENHDQPRSVNHFLKECNNEKEGAKALATILMTLRGTPFIYQGEEIGMTNVNRKKIEDYNDISTFNQYYMALNNGLNENEALNCVREYSRDNARSPMQWNKSKNAGFTNGNPWLAVNDNFYSINVDNEQKDENSVLMWYKKLSEIRNKFEVLISGSYKEILNDDENIYAYIRENDDEKMIILVNMSNSKVVYDMNIINGAKMIISSFSENIEGMLYPYQSICYYKCEVPI